MKPVPTSRKVDAISIGIDAGAIILAHALANGREAGFLPRDYEVCFLESAFRSAQDEWPEPDCPDAANVSNARANRLAFASYRKEEDRLFKVGLLGHRNIHSCGINCGRHRTEKELGLNSGGGRCCEVLPVVAAGRLDHVRIETPSGSLATRNLVISREALQDVPDLFLAHLGGRIFHNTESEVRLQAFGRKPPKRWLILGSGQHVVESIVEIHAQHSDAELVWVHWPIGFDLPDFRQQRGAVLGESLDRLKTGESHPITAKGYQNIVGLEVRADEYIVTLEDAFSGDRATERVGGIILATGSRQPLLPAILSNLQPWLLTGRDGGLTIDQNYRIATSDACDIAIFSNGVENQRDGIDDEQSFALMILRADWVARGLASRRFSSTGPSGSEGFPT